MTLTVHTVAALVIAQHTTDHLPAFLFGLISHIILDIIPHGDYHMHRWFNRGTKWRKMMLLSEIDLVISTLVASIFFYQYSADVSIFVWALLGSWLPDIPHIFFHLSRGRFMITLHRWHENIHFLEKWIKLNVKQSLVLQGLVIVILSLLF